MSVRQALVDVVKTVAREMASQRVKCQVLVTLVTWLASKRVKGRFPLV